jgi:hypothetical protein
MDFKAELAKELGLGKIAEETMLDNYVRACKAVAIRYHANEVKKMPEPIDKVQEFWYNGCIHESSAACVSLHRTTKGAEMAMGFYLEKKHKEFDLADSAWGISTRKILE